MLTVFYSLAALMIAGALAFVLIPLIRKGRHPGKPRAMFVTVLGVALLLPVSAVGLYAFIGTPAAIGFQSQQPNQKATLVKLVNRLQQELNQSPDNLQGWLLLAQTYGHMQEPVKARNAYQHAMKLAPENPDIMVAWVETASAVKPDHKIDGKLKATLDKALKLDPDNQRGLWLQGISHYQAGQFNHAIATWTHLHQLLKPESHVAQAVQRQITMAKARANGKTQREAEALLPQTTP